MRAVDIVSGPGTTRNDASEWPPTTLLGGLCPETAQTMLRLGTSVGFRGGEALLMEGDQSAPVFLIVGGWVKVIATQENGKDALIAIRSGGDLIGELASLDNNPRVAAVVAASSCLTRRIGQEQFLAFLAGHRDAAEAVTRTVVAKLRSSTRKRLEFSTCSIGVRIARILVELAGHHGTPTPDGVAITTALTQSDLAALVGAANPTTHRVLTALRRDGVISTGYRSIVIRDLPALRDLGQFDADADAAQPGDARWPAPLPRHRLAAS